MLIAIKIEGPHFHADDKLEGDARLMKTILAKMWCSFTYQRRSGGGGRQGAGDARGRGRRGLPHHAPPPRKKRESEREREREIERERERQRERERENFVTFQTLHPPPGAVALLSRPSA